jgi:predicted Holliday junction resolvase-like endonuclease
MNALVATIEGIQSILGICPCCGEIFRLSDAKLVFPKEKPKPSIYGDLLQLEAGIRLNRQAIEQEESDFEAEMALIKQQRTEAGRRSAQKKLLEIDPYFSRRGVNPKTVKVLFHPVEHIVFHCIDESKDKQENDGIELVSREPATKLQKTIATAIDRTLQSGNIEYHLLRLEDDGQFTVKTDFKPRLRRKSATPS